MGVPAFFRWLSKKYPSIVVHCVEEKAREVNNVRFPVDTTLPNPNGIEFDNLYLDMNGIIHPCCHPENRPAPKNEDEMMEAIFEHIDKLFCIVRPRKLLYMAIDGVAPRAKMNQQRSRRFRASKESREKIDDIKNIRQEIIGRGGFVPPEKPVEEHFDSNCITPGSEFMFNLAKCLRYYITDRLNNDLGWKNIEVILSDANVPGEGEHKIMDYIRRQRAQPDHDPNTHHCLCGADADLIMLGLATHEANFTIIREEFRPNQPKPCEICGQFGHEMKECTGAPKEKQGEFDELNKPIEFDQEYIFLRLPVLREYLEKELFMTGMPVAFNLERAIDDWVFMCFFVGNDFLPHLPSLQIREGAIDRLIRMYKNAVFKTGGYLTENGIVNLERVQMMMADLGEMEDEIFKKRRESDISFRNRRKRMNMQSNNGPRFGPNSGPRFVPGGQFSPQPLGRTPSPVHNARQEAYQMRQYPNSAPSTPSSSTDVRNSANMGAAQALRAMLVPAGSDKSSKEPEARGSKRKHDEMTEPPKNNNDDDDEPPDNIRLWEEGWKERYYMNKFDVSSLDTDFVANVVESYVEGLCWVLLYYYQGCPSWNWYYPYHYAPFGSDFIDVGKLPIKFGKGTQPFRPLEQLMSVFPEASSNFLPPTWRELMRDLESPIIDFYPSNFHIDLNGKKFAWQGVALLPFVDEKRLLRTLQSVYADLTKEEAHRNSLGSDKLYVSKHHPVYDFIQGLYEGEESSEEVSINPKLCRGMAGTVWRDEFVCLPGETMQSPLPTTRDIKDPKVLSISYRDPQYPADFIFKAHMLPGARLPEKVLKPGDFNQSGGRGRGRGQYRPFIGFNRSRGQGSLGQPGQRMVRHNMPGPYSNMPPPPVLGGRRGGQGGRNHHRSYSDSNAYGHDQGYQQSSNPYGTGSSNYSNRGGGSGYRQPQPNLAWSQNMASQQGAYQQNQQHGSYGGGGGGGGYNYGYPQQQGWSQSGQNYGGQRRSYPPPPPPQSGNQRYPARKYY